jgi:hypothetical protein
MVLGTRSAVRILDAMRVGVGIVLLLRIRGVLLWILRPGMSRDRCAAPNPRAFVAAYHPNSAVRWSRGMRTTVPPMRR